MNDIANHPFTPDSDHTGDCAECGRGIADGIHAAAPPSAPAASDRQPAVVRADGQRVHRLKCWPQFYDKVRTNEKRYEIRRDDRDFQVGDYLDLSEWDPHHADFPGPGDAMVMGAHTGRSLMRRVTYLMRDFPGLAPGYVLMSIAPIEAAPAAASHSADAGKMVAAASGEAQGEADLVEKLADIIEPELHELERRGFLVRACDYHGREHIVTDQAGEECCNECIADGGSGDLCSVGTDSVAIEIAHKVAAALRASNDQLAEKLAAAEKGRGEPMGNCEQCEKELREHDDYETWHEGVLMCKPCACADREAQAKADADGWEKEWGNLFDACSQRIRERDHLAADLAKVTAERNRLATDALCALSAAHIATPEAGYVVEPVCLTGDIAKLAKERDAEKARADAAEKALTEERAVWRQAQEARATHHCKVCDAKWIRWKDGNWTLASARCGQCCDNVAMGEQIEPIGLTAEVEKLRKLLFKLGSHDIGCAISVHSDLGPDAPPGIECTCGLEAALAATAPKGGG